jgi:hypothetical protein
VCSIEFSSLRKRSKRTAGWTNGKYDVHHLFCTNGLSRDCWNIGSSCYRETWVEIKAKYELSLLANLSAKFFSKFASNLDNDSLNFPVREHFWAAVRSCGANFRAFWNLMACTRAIFINFW